MRFLPVGDDALLVECADLAEMRAVHASVLERGVAATEVVPAARTVLLDGVPDPAGLAEQIAGWTLLELEELKGRLVELPVVYDGPDLTDVAQNWGVTPAEVGETHAGTEFVVAFCGFAPGFAYLTGLGRSVPRRDSPRSRVPTGSVGLAGEFTGVYPRESPGGWQLIGRTDAELWRPSSDEPALLTPGTRVRFVPAR